MITRSDTREEDRHRNGQPEIPAEGDHENAGGIGAHRHKGSIAQVEQAAVADGDVQAETENDVEESIGANFHHIFAGDEGQEQDDQTNSSQEAVAEVFVLQADIDIIDETRPGAVLARRQAAAGIRGRLDWLIFIFCIHRLHPLNRGFTQNTVGFEDQEQDQ